MHAVGNCKHCGNPVYKKGETYCSRTCMREDAPGALVEGCFDLGCYLIVGVVSLLFGGAVVLFLIAINF